jgi:hypothetical protein
MPDEGRGVVMLMTKSILTFLLFLAFLFQGCAVGNVYNFSDVKAVLQAAPQKNNNVAVATLDKRDVIVSKTCPPTYIGMQRAGFGNPWRVNTASGRPLSDDVTKAVSESLAIRGYRTLPVIVSYDLTEQQVKDLLIQKKADRSIFVMIRQWESDTYMNIGLTYEIWLMVFGPNQALLADTSVSDTKNIAGSFWDPPAAAKEKIPEAFKAVLEALLNDPKVIAALQ